MPQRYSNPKRENDPHALPDIETFESYAATRSLRFEAFDSKLLSVLPEIVINGAVVEVSGEVKGVVACDEIIVTCEPTPKAIESAMDRVQDHFTVKLASRFGPSR